MRIQSYSLLVVVSLSLLACGPRDRDKLDDNALASATGVEQQQQQPDSRCNGQAVQDEVKRQLFARAAQIRGSNSENYQRIAGFALIQLDGPAGASIVPGQMTECRVNATLRLPPGLKVAGGRTALSGVVAYSIAPGTSGTVTLGQSDAIAIPLATLTQNQAAAPVGPAAPSADQEQAPDPLAPREPQPQQQPQQRQVSKPRPQPQPEPRAAPAANSAARPSFNCRSARTSGERAVCDSASLAALDRAMAAQYRSAIANGGPDDRRLLAQTRDRFLNFRDRCSSDACIANTYRGRMREIDDIVAGRWRPTR